MLGRKLKRYTRRLITFFVWVLLVSGLILWRLDKSLPDFAVRWLERKLSSGDLVSFHCERASFNIFHGISLYDTRLYFKRTIGAPVANSREISFDWDIILSKPMNCWIRGVHADELNFGPLPDMPSSKSATTFDLITFINDISPYYNSSQNSCRITLENSKIFGVECKYAELELCVRDSKLYADNVTIIPKVSGYLETISGSAEYDPETEVVYVALKGISTPNTIRELTLILDAPEAVEYYDRVSKISAPMDVAMELRYDLSSTQKENYQDIRIEVKGTDFYFDDKAVRRFDMKLQWVVDPEDDTHFGKRLVISPINVYFAEGDLNGRIVQYPRIKATDFSATSTMDIVPILEVIDIKSPEFLNDIEFKSMVRTSINGRINSAPNEASSYLTGHGEASSFVWEDFEFSDFKTDLIIRGYNLLSLKNISTGICDGQLKGEINLDLGMDDEEGEISIKSEFDGIKTDKLRDKLSPSTTPSNGKIDGKLDLRTSLNFDNRTNLCGNAEIFIDDGGLHRAPLFAGLADFIGSNMPGMDLLLMQSDAEIKMSATNGLVTVEKLSLAGNLISVFGDGKCKVSSSNFPIEGVARIRFLHARSLLSKIVHFTTLPVSKLLEFRVYGPIKSPSWDYIGPIDRIAEATFWPRKDATEEEESNTASQETTEEQGKSE